MDQLFGSLKAFVKPQSCVIDNHIFRLHYKFSVLILVAFSIMVTARQYFGDPIDCISRDDIPTNLLDTYCWIHTTFSIESAWFKKVGVEVPYPGVDKYSPLGEGKRVYHAYYQWVCFVLFFQALLFYIPRYFWKAMEGGKIRNLVLGLNNPILSDETKQKNRGLLVEYLVRNRGQHNTSFAMYTIAEILNFFNVILQMYIMDRFLGGEFSNYGWKVIQFTEWDWSVRYDPMIRVFPRLTKCTFHRYGSSGDVQRHDAMCILPINIINEKIYVFLWFWFYFLAVASLVAIAYRALTIVIPRIRVLATQSRCRVANREALESVLNRLRIGDWFVLDLLSKNIDPLNFRDVIIDYYREIEGGKAADNI
ncbi:Innexin inx2 [Halotydeus destructor]|nr:Innexin inx2 [Halotydeus destructor]